MKSAFRKDMVRSISRGLGRFLAIAGIVALGCGFYAGLRMTGPDMRLAGDRFYDGTHLYDIRMLCSLGFTQDQLDEVREVEGVQSACAAKSTDIIAMLNDEQYAMRVISFDAQAAAESTCEDGVNVSSSDDAYLNRLVLVEGSWPKKAGECILSTDRVMGTPIQVGDVVKVLYGSKDLDGVLAVREFTVTGLAHSSSYVSSVTLGSTSLGSGSIEQFAYVTEDSFDEDCPYTELFVRAAGAAEELSGGDAYQSRVDEVAGRLDGLAQDLAESRLEQVKGDAQAKVDDARSEFDEERAKADAEIAEGQAKLDDAAGQLREAEQKIASGQAEYDAGVLQLQSSCAQADAQLAAARQKLQDTAAQIAQGESDVAAAQEQLDSQRMQYEQSRVQWEADKEAFDAGYAQVVEALDTAQQGVAELEAQLAALSDDDPARSQVEEQLRAAQAQVAELQASQLQMDGQAGGLEAAKAQIDAAGQQIEGGQAQIDASRAQLQQGKRQLEDGWAQYYRQEAQASAQIADAQQQLDSAAGQLEIARTELSDGKDEYDAGVDEFQRRRDDAYGELDDAQREIDEAQSDVDGIELPDVYVLDRTANYGVESYRADSERIDNIASVFPLIFFLVAALVALTTMTRMVDEERALIGTYKALGYSRARITGKYLAYAAAASITGAAIGIGALSQVLPATIAKAYAIIYHVPAHPLPLPIDVPLALLALGLGVGITLFATWAAVATTLREQPASLMLPRSPKAGKQILLQRIAPIWRRLSFSWKVTCRNLFRYKKRFWMTVAGIAGCTALLLTGLGLHDAIWDIIDKQYGPIVRYNVVVEFKEDATEQDVQEVLGFVEQSGDATKMARAQHANMQIASDSHAATDIEVTTPENMGEISELIVFKQRIGQHPVAIDDKSVVLTEKMARTLDVGVGDTITLYDQDEVGNPVGVGHELQVTGIMEYYVGHALFVGRDAWEDSIGGDIAFNALYATCTEDAQERAAFTEELHGLDQIETVTYNDETIDSYRKMLSSVNMIVVVLVVAAAGLAAIVLYNLTNINITERRREIASLKVLGFTKGEVNSYIFREIILLALIGAALGLILGYFLEGFVVATAEVDYVMFGRDIHVMSFALGYILTMLFTVAILFTMRGKLGKIDMVESLKSIE